MFLSSKVLNYPGGHGLIESLVQTIKIEINMYAEDGCHSDLAVLQLRATPLESRTA